MIATLAGVAVGITAVWTAVTVHDRYRRRRRQQARARLVDGAAHLRVIRGRPYDQDGDQDRDKGRPA